MCVPPGLLFCNDARSLEGPLDGSFELCYNCLPFTSKRNISNVDRLVKITAHFVLSHKSFHPFRQLSSHSFKLYLKQ